MGSYLKKPVTGGKARPGALLLGMISVPKGPYDILASSTWHDVDEAVDSQLAKSVLSGHIKKRIDVKLLYGIPTKVGGERGNFLYNKPLTPLLDDSDLNAYFASDGGRGRGDLGAAVGRHGGVFPEEAGDRRQGSPRCAPPRHDLGAERPVRHTGLVDMA